VSDNSQPQETAYAQKAFGRDLVVQTQSPTPQPEKGPSPFGIVSVQAEIEINNAIKKVLI
jgi:hypothetical protein